MDNQILPHSQKADEIGKLAHRADMLKDNMIGEQTLKQEIKQMMLQNIV